MSKSKRFVLGLIVATLAIGSTRASADDSELPFEVTVVLSGCDESSVGVDRLVSTLAEHAAADSLERPATYARTIHVSFRSPSCLGERDDVHVVVQVGDGALVREEFEVLASGDTADGRAESVAVAAHETLRSAWPTLLAAASNPYVADAPPLPAPALQTAFVAGESAMGGDLVANPYRRAPSRQIYGVGSSLADLVPNPYRTGGSTEDRIANPYRE